MNAELTIKDQARHLVEKLSEDASWDDVMYQVYVRQSIEAGLKDCREGRTVSTEEVRRRLGIPS